jgi:hypothetical protein
VDSLKLELFKTSSTAITDTTSSSVATFHCEASQNAVDAENYRSAPQTIRCQSEISPAMQVHNKIKRIADLEQELVSSKLEFACAKSYEDCLKLQLEKMRHALAKAASSNVTASLRLEAPIALKLDLQSLLAPLSPKKICAYAHHANEVLSRGTYRLTLELFDQFDSLIHPSTEVDSRGWGKLSPRRPNNNKSSDRPNGKPCPLGLKPQFQSRANTTTMVSRACSILLSTQSLSGAFSIVLSTQDDNSDLVNNSNTTRDGANTHTAFGCFLRFC